MRKQLTPRSPERRVPHRGASLKGSSWSLTTQLRVVLATALFGSLIVAAIVSWEQWFPTPPERLVKIYRTHGCRCAFVFADSLKAAGFEVRLVEYRTLKRVREALRTPPTLRGCHVGEYLGYFLEGHVSPSTLPQLTSEHPAGLGVATESSASTDITHVSIKADEQSPVLLIEPDGRARPWFEPPHGEPEG